jgi:hypothetical protein
MGTKHLFNYIHGLSGLCYGLSTIHLIHKNVGHGTNLLTSYLVLGSSKLLFKIKVHAFKKNIQRIYISLKNDIFHTTINVHF